MQDGLREVVPMPDEKIVAELMENALSYGRRHFAHHEVSIAPHPDHFFSPSGNLLFVATHENGRTAEVVIQIESGRLLLIDSQNNLDDLILEEIIGGTG
jgi:hypothetical protein